MLILTDETVLSKVELELCILIIEYTAINQEW